MQVRPQPRPVAVGRAMQGRAPTGTLRTQENTTYDATTNPTNYAFMNTGPKQVILGSIADLKGDTGKTEFSDLFGHYLSTSIELKENPGAVRSTVFYRLTEFSL